MNEPAPRKIIQGADLSGMDVRDHGTRSGNAERERAKNHVKKMADLGYIKDDEKVAREDFIDLSEQKNELTAVMSDLPPLEETKEPFIKLTKFNWHKREWYIPILAIGCILALVLTVVPAVTVRFATLPARAFSTACLVIGIPAFIALLWSLCYKLYCHDTIEKRIEAAVRPCGHCGGTLPKCPRC